MRPRIACNSRAGPQLDYTDAVFPQICIFRGRTFRIDLSEVRTRLKSTWHCDAFTLGVNSIRVHAIVDGSIELHLQLEANVVCRSKPTAKSGSGRGSTSVIRPAPLDDWDDELFARLSFQS